MKKVTKKFSFDVPLAEFAEIDKAIQRTGKGRREWLLSVVRANNKSPRSTVADETLQKTIENAQKQIDDAYQMVADLYLDAGADLLQTDREKGKKLLSKALTLKAPTIDTNTISR